MRSIYRPQTLIELAMVRSLLVAHDIPYYVHNDGYASLFPGIQMHLLNVPIVMVPAPLVESAKKLFALRTVRVIANVMPQNRPRLDMLYIA
jgi:putative signal transducing protein